MSLLALYAGCLVLGAILIGASVAGAGKDVDHGALGHAEAGGHADAVDHVHGHLAHHADTNGFTDASATLLSLRFWTFALAAFGLTGLLLHLIGFDGLGGAGIAGGTDLVVGGAVTTLLRVLSRDTVSSALDARALRGREAEVVLSVGPSKTGKIRLRHLGQLLEIPASTVDPRVLERGVRVLVVDVRGGTAEITGMAPERPLLPPVEPPS